MKLSKAGYSIIATLIVTGLALPVVAQDTGTPNKEALEKAMPAKRPYSPYADRPFPTRVFWGDTHLHTCGSSN